MARRSIAAVIVAAALLLIPQTTALAQLPDTGQLPGGGLPTTPPLPEVELPEGTPKLPIGEPEPGGGGGEPAGGGSGGSASTPTERAPSLPGSPEQRQPAGGQPAKGSPEAGTPATAPERAKDERAGRGGGKSRDGGASSRSERGGGSAATSSREPSPGGHERSSTFGRVVDQIPTGVLTALAVSSLLAAAFALFWLRERYTIRSVRRKALRDPLTGIGNRLAFEQRLAQEWKRARRYGRPLGVLLLDVDGLKRVNDNEGHSAGDDLLRSVAERIEADIREPDLAARLAGDEFVVLCPETTFAGMQQLAAKLEGQLEGGDMRASIGCAEMREGDESPDDMVARADEAMYRVKESRGGRRAEVTAPLGLATAT